MKTCIRVQVTKNQAKNIFAGATERITVVDINAPVGSRAMQIGFAIITIFIYIINILYPTHTAVLVVVV